VAGPASAQEVPRGALEALDLPEAWETATGAGVTISAADPAAAEAATTAAPDAEVMAAPGGDVVAVTDSDQLPDPGDVVIVSPADLLLPDDVLAVRVGIGDRPTDPSVVTAPVDDPATAVGLVAGVAALLVGQGLTPPEVTDLVTGTAQNLDGDPALGAGLVDAATAVEQASGVEPLVDQPEGGGLSPALIGAVALGAALVTFGILAAIARPRRPS
jgi:hypothetical protein